MLHSYLTVGIIKLWILYDQSYCVLLGTVYASILEQITYLYMVQALATLRLICEMACTFDSIITLEPYNVLSPFRRLSPIRL